MKRNKTIREPETCLSTVEKMLIFEAEKLYTRKSIKIKVYEIQKNEVGQGQLITRTTPEQYEYNLSYIP